MKRTAAFIFAAVMMLVLTACGNDAAGKELVLTTGNIQGTYYVFGATLADEITQKGKISVTTIASGGSKVNIEALQSGDAQLAFVQSDVAAYAYAGERLFDRPVDIFSTVAALYKEQVQIVTTDPEIKSVADLAGRHVSVGASGSGVYFNASDILEAYGIDINRDINPSYLSFSESAAAMRAGSIDAAFVVAGEPTAAITRLSETSPVYLISLDEEHIDALLQGSPYYSRSLISKGTYGAHEDIPTVAVTALIVARNDVEKSDIYNFISTIFENRDEIIAAHKKGQELDVNFAASYEAVPYHPGAVKYLTKMGAMSR